ncbi:MAG: VOC family protein [Planctomycetaceae bacterium]|nr:VOC family protein [Planctomycetaceae bacterium]
MRRNLIITFMLLAGVVVWFHGKDSVGDDVEKTWFRTTTVDFGIVVSDIDKSVAFYRDVLGMNAASSFNVSTDIAREAGLTKNEPLTVQVMTLGKESTATKVKLMQVEGTAPQKQNLEYINSTLGMSYMTLHVTNVSEVLKNAAEYDVKPIANGPTDISRGSGNNMVLAIVRDPDGNLVELVGPLN